MDLNPSALTQSLDLMTDMQTTLQRAMEQRSKLTRSLDPLQNQLCRVCDEPAAGFHFGAFTCEGCKSFFGRTCNNPAAVHECKNNYNCVVDKRNRTACKACRLRKCLMVGMSKSGSRYGRRSNWFKIHCLMQQQQSGSSPDSSSLTTASLLQSLQSQGPKARVKQPKASVTSALASTSSKPESSLSSKGSEASSTLLASGLLHPLLLQSQILSHPSMMVANRIKEVSTDPTTDLPMDLTVKPVMADNNENVINLASPTPGQEEQVLNLSTRKKDDP